jgi:hypothetical protein
MSGSRGDRSSVRLMRVSIQIIRTLLHRSANALCGVKNWVKGTSKNTWFEFRLSGRCKGEIRLATRPSRTGSLCSPASLLL